MFCFYKNIEIKYLHTIFITSTKVNILRLKKYIDCFCNFLGFIKILYLSPWQIFCLLKKIFFLLHSLNK